MRVICKRDPYRYIRLTIRFINRQFHIDHNTNFCIDTGAPYSLISYERAVEWRIPFDRLTLTPGKHSVGGIEAEGYFLRDSTMLFRDTRGKLHSVAVDKIVVLGPPFKTPPIARPIFPLLGDDILRQFNLIVKSDKDGGEITLTDETMQISFPVIH